MLAVQAVNKGRSLEDANAGRLCKRDINVVIAEFDLPKVAVTLRVQDLLQLVAGH
jgi:hypothetical protein